MSGATRTTRQPALLSVTDIAIREAIGYQLARDRALRGVYGQPIRQDGRLYVRPADFNPKPAA